MDAGLCALTMVKLSKPQPPSGNQLTIFLCLWAGIAENDAQVLILKHGTDRATLMRAAKELRRQQTERHHGRHQDGGMGTRHRG